MSDAMQVAQKRRTDYKNAIARKTNEIAELNELIADLDNFIGFGEALLGDPGEKAREVSRPVAVTQSSNEADEWESDEDDEWGSDEPQQSVVGVLPTHAG